MGSADRADLFAPRRSQYAIAKILALEPGYHEGAYISLDISKGRLRLMLESPKKCRDDLFLEILAREQADDRFPVFGRKVLISFSHHIQPYTGIHKGHFRLLVFCDTDGGMQRNSIPYQLQSGRGETMAFQKGTGCVGAIHFESFIRAAIMWDQTEIVKNGAYIEQLGIIAKSPPLAVQRRKKKNPQRVIVDEVRSMFQ